MSDDDQRYPCGCPYCDCTFVTRTPGAYCHECAQGSHSLFGRKR